MARPALPLGTVRPGPRGYGWRVKLAAGWQPCDEFGNQLTAPARRTLGTIVEQTATAPVSEELERAMAIRAASRHIGNGYASDGNRRARARRVQAGKFTGIQLTVLNALKTTGPLTAMEIHTQTGVHLGSVSKRLQTLIDAGLVRGVRREGRRTVYACTEKGLAA